MALVGNLKDLKLPSLIQLNCMERNTAKLTIEHNGRYGFIYFEKGQLVHAEFDPFIGEEAVYKLLELYSGNFKVEGGIRAPVHSIKTPWNNLLLEGMRLIDDGDESQERKYDHLFERLLTIKGVSSALLIDNEGTIVANSSPVDEKQGALFALIMYESEKFGELTDREKPEFVSIAASPHKYIISSYNKLYLVLELEAKIKLDIILPLLKQALT